MFAIYKKELKSYFHSFIGLLFIAVTLCFVSLYYFIYNLLGGYPYFSYSISGVTFLFLIAIPVLSMRILAEERRSKTDQMILTAPVSVGGIVLGKFLALLTIFAIPAAVLCTYPLILRTFGTVPMPESYLAILGFFLYGMACISIGMFISALTESQVISAVLTFIVLFAGYMMTSLCSMISQTGNLLTKLLGCLDMYTPFSEMMSGTLNLKSVLYYFLLTALALFLTVQAIQKRRYSISVKTLSVGAYSTGAIALMIVLIVAVNLVLDAMPMSWVNIDITPEKLYSLTDQTKEFVKTVDQDVTIYVISAKEGQDTTLGQTLERYDDLSNYITVEYVDPNVNPKFYQQYTDRVPNMNSLIVVSEKRYKIIDYNDIYEVAYDYNYSTGGYSTTQTGYDGEGQITSALDYVLSDNMPKLYMTEGHGEGVFSSTFTAALKKENVEYETINLMDYEAVPEDAAGLVIFAPTADFSADDRDKVTDYLKRGGNVVISTNYTPDAKTPNLDAVLDYMGLSVVNGLVVEQDTKQYYQNPYYLLPNISSGKYTSGLYGQYYVFAPFSQGILIQQDKDESLSFNSFLNTSKEAFAKMNALNSQNYDKQDGDIQGPFSLGVEAVRKLEDGGSATLVAYACAQMFMDEANTMVGGANLMLFTNTLGGFVSHEVSVSIPVKKFELAYLTIPQSNAVTLGILTIVVLPVGCLLAGFVIWFRRRKR